MEVLDRRESRLPELPEVRDRLVGDYNRMRAERAKDALFEGLSTRYDVEIDQEAVKGVALKSSE